ncbi:transcriptional regulator, TetR family [Kribbella flavida DSM 17836]|uniref:Transcriptional regulator, TetR family n=1 Tax=Kribbella flavida (strain DSM 17836 / JCM 10339 / NBRC 14399) TaxID=479435 RepID=D2Q0Q8_KRIFD|nr:TetR/AcrR family transcriptional regulator [Kribbella flavida]ADB33858.1 transcriptional regulator, TetR family [Kribbella flavida DSM 17836]
MGLRELKRERTRRLISDKAFELFTDHGFGRTTVEQIAAAAEVGPSTLYRYFPTKETLVLEFVEHSLFGALDWFREQPADAELPDALEQVIGRVLDLMESNPDRVRAVYELAGQTPSLSAHLTDATWRWRTELSVELERRLPGAGSTAGLTAKLAAGIAMNIIEIVVETWVAAPDGPSVKDLAKNTLGLLRDGAIPLPRTPH